MTRRLFAFPVLAFALAASGAAGCAAPVSAQQATSPATQTVRTTPESAGPVRNLAADPQMIGSEGVVTLRYWKIEKGKFPEFLAASQRGVWPYFEKIGARVIGMWLVTPAPGESEASPDYDEVYLATRYASAEHWAATRDAASMGGDGPDYEALQDALSARRALSLETRLTFLSGATGPMGPYFLPGTMEQFETAQ